MSDSDWELAAQMAVFLVKLYDEYRDLDSHYHHSLAPQDLADLKVLVEKVRPITKGEL